MGQSYSNGGHVRVLDAQGALIYDYDTNQEVVSSPAVGGFLANGATGIAVGTGTYYPGTTDTDTVKAFTTRLGLVWSDTLEGPTSSSPALADVEGNGQLDVVEGSETGWLTGSVWVLDGANGSTVWEVPAVSRIIGSVVAADLSGRGYQDLLVPTVHGVEVLDGRSGSEVTVLGPRLGFQNSPLVTEDPNGTVGITIAGYNGDNVGVVQHTNPGLERSSRSRRWVVAHVPPRPVSQRGELGLARLGHSLPHGADGAGGQRRGFSVVGRAHGRRYVLGHRLQRVRGHRTGA